MPLFLGMPVGRTMSAPPASAARVLEEHHQLLDELLATVRAASADKAFAAARGALDWFRVELDRHVRVEEQLMFPLFDGVMGRSEGPTGFRCAEHRQINALLDRIAASLAQDRDSGDELAELVALFETHNRKEEQMFYPLIHRRLADSDQAALFEDARRLLDAPLAGDGGPLR